MTDGLKDEHREAIIAAIAANDRVERAVLFGSRATGTNTVSSDVDIALVGDRLTLTDQARLSAVLDKFPMAQSVDLLLYDSIQDWTLREHIRRQGIEWYALGPRRVRIVTGRPPPHPVLSAPPSCRTAVETVFGWQRRDAGSIDSGWLSDCRLKNDRAEVYSELPAGSLVIRGTNISKDRKLGGTSGSYVSDADRFREDRTSYTAGVKTKADLEMSSSRIEGLHWQKFAIIRRRQSEILSSTRTQSDEISAGSLDREIIDLCSSSTTSGCGDTGRFSLRSGAIAPLKWAHRPSRSVSLDQLRRQCSSSHCLQVEEQRTYCGHPLGLLDDKIELNRRMNATLEELWRGRCSNPGSYDFDPVRAKMNRPRHGLADGDRRPVPRPANGLRDGGDSERVDCRGSWRHRRRATEGNRSGAGVYRHALHRAGTHAPKVGRSEGLGYLCGRIEPASSPSTFVTSCSGSCDPISTRWASPP